MTDDKDRPKISPSMLNRIALCPASPWRERDAPPDLSDKSAAEMGTRLHAAVARQLRDGLPTEGLTPDEETILARCILEAAPFWGEESVEELFEVHLDCGAGTRGTADLVRLFSDIHQVLDWKMGWAEWIIPACDDYQLRAYACGVWNYLEALGRPPFDIHIERVHPRLFGDLRRSSAIMPLAHRAAYTSQIEALVASSTPESKARPSKAACDFCDAKTVCPERIAWSAPAQALTRPEPRALTVDEITRALSFDGPLQTATKAMDEYKAHARVMLLADGNAIPGWTLKDGSRTCELTCPIPEAAARLQADGVSPETVLSACKMSLPALETAVYEATPKEERGKGGTTKKSVKDEVAAILDGVVEYGRNQPSVVPRKDEPC